MRDPGERDPVPPGDAPADAPADTVAPEGQQAGPAPSPSPQAVEVDADELAALEAERQRRLRDLTTDDLEARIAALKAEAVRRQRESADDEIRERRERVLPKLPDLPLPDGLHPLAQLAFEAIAAQPATVGHTSNLVIAWRAKRMDLIRSAIDKALTDENRNLLRDWVVLQSQAERAHTFPDSTRKTVTEGVTSRRRALVNDVLRDANQILPLLEVA